MKIKNTITDKTIEYATSILAPFIPNLNETALIEAIEQYDRQGVIKGEKSLEKPFTIAETMEILQMSKPTIYKYFKKGTFTHGGEGRNVLIPAEDIQNFIHGKSRDKIEKQ